MPDLPLWARAWVEAVAKRGYLRHPGGPVSWPSSWQAAFAGGEPVIGLSAWPWKINSLLGETTCVGRNWNA